MKILIIAVESLSFSTGSDFHTQSRVDNGIASVCVSCLPVVIMVSLVNKDREEFSTQGVDQPFFSSCFTTGDEASAASCLGWEEISLMFS
jgi:hypothetical protein